MRLIDASDGSLVWQSRSNVTALIAREVVGETSLFTTLSEEVIADRTAKSIQMMAGSAQIRCPADGVNMEAFERKAAGAPARTRMDRHFWDSLSDKGRTEPVTAAEIVYHRTLSALSAFECLVKFRELGIRDCKFSASGSSRQCAAASRLNGTVLRTEHIISWPITECDAPWCPCTLIASLSG